MEQIYINIYESICINIVHLHDLFCAIHGIEVLIQNNQITQKKYVKKWY